MTIKKLSAMPYAQAHTVINTDGSVDLISYTTRVARISANGWLVVYGLYSMTTRRHISAFLKEYAPPIDFHTAKRICMDKMIINVATGEVIDWG